MTSIFATKRLIARIPTCFNGVRRGLAEIPESFQISKFIPRKYRVRKWNAVKTNGADLARVHLAKTVCWLIRHAAEREGIRKTADGFVNVSHLLKHPKMRHVDFATLQYIEKSDTRRRFHIFEDPIDPRTWWISASPQPWITSPSGPAKPVSPKVIGKTYHGTTEEAWEKISTEGIKRMSREHIHLADLLYQDGVTSGMVGDSRVLIEIDVEAASAEGIRFYREPNSNILTPGNEFGVLEPRFFRSVRRVSRQAQVMHGKDMRTSLNWDSPPQDLQKPKSQKKTRDAAISTKDERTAVQDEDGETRRKWKPEELAIF